AFTFVLVLATVGGVAIARWATRTGLALAQAVERLADGDDNAPLPQTSVTEIARLTDAFETLRRRLAQRKLDQASAEEELRTLNLDLEQRVAARTAELQEAVEALESQTLHDALTGLPNRVLLRDR